MEDYKEFETENKEPTATKVPEMYSSENENLQTTQEPNVLENTEILQDVQKNNTCKNCGNELLPGMEFCPKCGEKHILKNETKKCWNCGAEIKSDETFCDQCGKQINNELEIVKNNINRKKRNIFIVIAIALLLAVLVTSSAVVLPKVLVSTNELLSQGRYEEAYKKAKDDEKNVVIAENIIAHICVDVVNSLKNPSSFELREAWYDYDNNQVVLQVGGTNSYGGIVSSYWYYTYDEDDKDYNLYTTVSDFEEEKTYSWDDWDDKLETLLDNAAKKAVKKIIQNDSYKLDASAAVNINGLFKNNQLKDIKIINNSENKK